MGFPAEGESAAEPAAARAGARFPSARQLERYADEQPAPGPQLEKRNPERPSGARFPTERQLERFADEQPPPDPPAQVDRSPKPVPPKPVPSPRPRPRPRVDEEPMDDGPRVRPYVLTKGRTQSAYELALETMVSLRADARWSGAALNSEYQPVRALCAAPQSVAEVAAGLSMPLGVARVLLSDMAELGLLHIHGTARTAEGRPPMALMRRVLAGLQRL
ncbi:DUF742 domain-containing protein [Amycolatopsis acidicola]|uniref:DUF742 domain-containing protein n=1 Tax=Amycolatopsis acidicola TaxID=2596893 RepID=A0A5N0UQ92_9PSEU|nr:DUF742 domain-containing protein [Amycolatopsis acidicola]KAA9153073.1 DUF742 domain-containing protein [Amycolatopsis acidicola]